MDSLHLEIARLIGEPINTQLPVPVELSAIANVVVAEPGEIVYRYQAMDKDADYILNIDANCVITPVKKSPMGETPLTFTGLNSRLEYVCVNDVLSSPDTKVLGRKKEAITRGMDKSELKIILDACLANTNVPNNQNVQEFSVTGPSTGVDGDDLYDVILGMKHLLEDYGDGFVLMVGSTVKEKIDTYDKDHVGTYNYRVGLAETLANLGITVMKVFGKVDRGSGEVVLLDAKKMIMVAVNSRIAQGKPITFVRRRISPEIATLMGANVDNAQRAIFANPVPVQAVPPVTGGTQSNLLAYGVLGYESIVMAITNPLAIVKADATLII
jgi:hypothetical protein